MDDFFRYFCPNEHTGKRHNLFFVLSKFQVICLWKASSDSLERRWIDNLYDQQPLWSTTFVIHRPIFWMAGSNINIIMKLRQREWELSWLKSTVEADWPLGHCLAGRSLAVMLSPHQWSMPCLILSPPPNFYFYFGLITSSTTCFFCSGLTKPACFYIGSPLVAFQHLPTGYLLKFRALDKKQWSLRADSHLWPNQRPFWVLQFAKVYND